MLPELSAWMVGDQIVVTDQHGHILVQPPTWRRYQTLEELRQDQPALLVRPLVLPTQTPPPA